MDAAATEWTQQAGRLGEVPAVMRWRERAFEQQLGRPEYATAVVVQVALNEPTDDGLSTSAETEQLDAIEHLLTDLVDERALLVSVLTGDGLVQYTWYSENAEWAGDLLDGIDASTATHGMRVLARTDPQWYVARQLLDE